MNITAIVALGIAWVAIVVLKRVVRSFIMRGADRAKRALESN